LGLQANDNLLEVGDLRLKGCYIAQHRSSR
jgi:hypothetical protein